MVEQTVQWRFARGDAGADEIQSTVDEILVQLTDSTSEAWDAARAAGLEPAGWRSLLARAAVFHATRRMLGNLCDLAERVRAVEMVLDQLQLRAQEVSEEDDDATAVAQVVTAWDGDLSRVLELRRVEADVLRLLAEVRAALEHACGGGPVHGLFRGVRRGDPGLYGSARATG